MKYVYKIDPKWPKAPRLKTMTVSELIAELSRYPSDMAVVAEWEGTLNAFESQSFSVGSNPRFEEQALVIYVDTH